MLRAPVTMRLRLALLALIALGLLGAPGASAVICPTPYIPGNPNAPLGPPNGGMYCVFSGGTYYRDMTRSMNPTLYFRLGDAAGAPTMGGDNGLPNGEYKNKNDSDPIGIADDGDAARVFFGSTGYGFLNGIEAPNYHGTSPYGDYTMEIWFKLGSGVTGGGIMEFGGAGAVYVSNKVVYFQNGSDRTAGITIPNANLGNWHFVVARKCGNQLTLQLQQSTQDPFVWWQPSTASGTSSYRPEGQPTFYVGYNNQTGASWFNGSLDEGAYFRYCVSDDDLFLQYEDDPVPDPKTMVVGGPVGGSPPAGTAAAKTPANKPTKPGPLTKAQRIAHLKLQIKSLSYDYRLLRIEYTSLRIHGASQQRLKQARAAIAKVSHQLALAKKALKKLQAKPRPKHKAKPKPKRPLARH